MSNAQGDWTDVITMPFSLKYDPKVIKSVLFSAREPSRKRQRVESQSDEPGMEVDGEPESTVEEANESEDHPREREIVLETSKDKFLISPSTTCESESPSSKKYTVALITNEEAPQPEPQADEKPKAVDPPVPAEVQAKPPPPTWSTPPAELDPSRTKPSALPRKSSTPKPVSDEKPAPMRKQLVAKVLSRDRELEQFRFNGNEVCVEGLDDKINVERWRWALVGEFVLN